MSRLVIWAFYLLTGAVLFNYGREMRWEALSAISPAPHLLAAAFFAMLFSRFLFSNTFRVILGLFSGARPGFVRGNFAYARSWISRYVPGKVAVLVGRALFFGRLGASNGEVVFSSVVEFGLSVPVGVAVGLLCLGLAGSAGELDPTVGRYSLWAALLLPFLMAPRLVNFMVGRGLVLIGRAHLAEGLRVDFKGLLAAFSGVTANQAAVGFAYWLTAAALDPRFSPSTLPLVAGIFCLAGALSTMVLFAPTGLGVKEVLLMPFLVRAVPVETALALLVAARAVEFAADLSYLGVSWLLAGRAGREAGALPQG